MFTKLKVDHLRVVGVKYPVLAVVAVLLALIIRFLHKGLTHRRRFKDLPCPPHSLLWGHIAVIISIATCFPPNTHPQTIYTEIARRYSLEGIFYIDLWPVAPSSVVLTDPTLIEHVTTLHPLRVHPLGDNVMAPVVGKGVIITSNGALWKKLHSMMVPAFSWKHIRGMTGIIVDECELFRDALAKRAGTGRPFSMMDLGARLIFDIIAQAVFNLHLHAQTKGSVYLRDLHEMTHLAEGQLTDPAVVYNPVKRAKVWWRRRCILKSLNPSMEGKIRERLELLLTQGIVPSRKDPTSILDLMLREHVQGEKGQGKDKADYDLPDEDLQLILTNLKGALLGGHGTTVDTLCYTLMFLSNSPKILQKLRDEHDKFFSPNHEACNEILVSSPEKLQDLRYTDAVLRETLRLFPVGIPLREADPGATLTCDDREYPIDGGLAIALNGHDLHYNPKFFPEPTAFKPERWLDPDNEIPRYYFRTFSRGARACLGMNLAMNELKVVLLMILRDYEFRSADRKPNPVARSLHTDLDTIYGDAVFQEIGIEAKPRGPMRMLVRKCRV